MKHTYVIALVCALVLASSATAAPGERQLLQADDDYSGDYQTMATLSATANENGNIIPSSMVLHVAQDPQDDLEQLVATQLADFHVQRESGMLLPGAYGGSLAMASSYGGYASSVGEYGGLLESGQLQPEQDISITARPESLPAVVVSPNSPADEKTSKPLETLPSTIQASASSSDSSTAAAVSTKSAAGMQSMAVQVVLLAVSMAVAMAV
jgi:hypothetical protein